ncbi:1,4-alpha-glucan branching enzyme [Enterococcus sp. DIV2402]|uniref:1,4-alpha-glucan branching enzyme n=1 Tax=Candidatus Enterococcus lowellii TaxID=2230877 RepID=A0ABZ2SUB6_9ENTE|nr:alpha-amylase family glycosyl hydrolase [Enterococcus sp. DIV2402]MBO0465057.1 alpha amylase C-terminal domain-containing protein [Enterococcus sp. DIV2402]
MLSEKILEIDPFLKPYISDIRLRNQNYLTTKKRLLEKGQKISSFANGHHYFGFHKQKNGWIYREWAPNAKKIALIGEFNQWNRTSHLLKNIGDGVWEIQLTDEDQLVHGSKVRIEITTENDKFERIPTYCKRVVQKKETVDFDGQVWDPPQPFEWTDQEFKRPQDEPVLIYESHVGMAGIKEGISSFQEYIETVLPRVKELGYNTIQLMAIAEHPYYGSFGYQVSNFFAVSSKFGTPEDLKLLIDTAHSLGISVLLDIVHSHSATNVVEGLAQFDGTETQYFHAGDRGTHPEWGSKLFNYGKTEVIHFLLSNVKYWLEEYHFDGFRFDAVTSMLYHHHGLGVSFDHYDKYFSINTDTEALTYLQLAAEVAKEVAPDCILIAEDMSGMPGMCLPIDIGGIGFDYRLGMGVPDFWIKTLKNTSDYDWNLGSIWYELNQRRPQEKVVGYCESHDQALVGDKTIMFRLADQEMYWKMDVFSQSDIIDRAIALHKMIRLITCTCAGEGYLNFMGNEFGHPEWIDFPSPDNNWSYSKARRRWDLAEDTNLRYRFLQSFDHAMIELVKENNLLATSSELLLHHEDHKLLAYQKGEFVFIYNFHPVEQHTVNLQIDATKAKLILHSDWQEFGGYLDSTNEQKPLVASSTQFSIPINRRSVAVYKI